MKRIFLAVLLFSGVGLWSAQVVALKLIPDSCWANVSNGAVNFGNYDTFNIGNLDSTGTITVSCRVNLLKIGVGGGTTSFDIELNEGGGGSFNPRAMSNGINTLAYNLYTDSNRSTIWGNGSGQGVKVTGSIDFPSIVVGWVTKDKSFTIYGRTQTGKSISAGTYSDTITATVLY